MKKAILLAALAFGTLGLVSYRTGPSMQQIKLNGIQDQPVQCFTYVIYYQPRKADGTVNMSNVVVLDRGTNRTTLFGMAMFIDSKVNHFAKTWYAGYIVFNYVPVNCNN